MKIIAHRGNLRGPKPELENNPEYLLIAISKGYDVEVDVWYDKVREQLFLGHDYPKYPIEDKKFLKNEHMWCHAKNLDALEFMLKNKIHCFWHEHDERTLTSKGYIWTYPYKDTVPEKSVICMISPDDQAPKDCYGICTDWVTKHK
jgi:hypothetical protein